MTKADLVDQVTALGDLTRRDGEIIVDTLFESVIAALKADDKVEICYDTEIPHSELDKHRSPQRSVKTKRCRSAE